MKRRPMKKKYGSSKKALSIFVSLCLVLSSGDLQKVMASELTSRTTISTKNNTESLDSSKTNMEEKTVLENEKKHENNEEASIDEEVKKEIEETNDSSTLQETQGQIECQLDSEEEEIDETQVEESENDIQPSDLLNSRMSILSIGGIIEPADKLKLAVIPGTDGSMYQTYDATTTGLRQALYNLYLNGANQEFVIYFGGSVTFSRYDLGIGAKAIPPSPTDRNITFSSLEGRVKTLTMVGSYTDPMDTTTELPSDATGAAQFSLPAGEIYAGSNIVFRNIQYDITKLYMQGHDATLDHGSYDIDGMTIIGGTNLGNITGDPVITINSTGDTSFYQLIGGNESGGTLTGSTSIIVNDTSKGLGIIYGGPKGGTVTGNVSTQIRHTNGNIGAFYGGGGGTYDKKRPANSIAVNVGGDVFNSIENIGGTVARTYGGVIYGDIGGSITNIIRGSGTNITSNPAAEVQDNFSCMTLGGSFAGTVGSNLKSQGRTEAINNTFDFSEYTGTSRAVFASNFAVGTIWGDVNTVATAGNFGSGAITGFQGGCGILGEGYNVTDPTQSSFRVFGNITSELTKGCFSTVEGQAGWARGAGYGGYIEGNTLLRVGTQGLAYGGDNEHTDMTYRSSVTVEDASRGDNTKWDLVGAGGNISVKGLIYIKGNTTLIQDNVLARWTYGGGFNGTIIGNTSNTLNGGIVETMEGSGYAERLIVGNAEAIVNDGEVDWYLSGGSWDTERVEGNTSLTVRGGVINAHVGGTYGGNNEHIITGDAVINLFDGDFSGIPHKGNRLNKRVAGGPSNAGTIEGNITVNIDFSNAINDFKLPPGSNLAGGVAYETTIEAGRVPKVGKNGTDTSITVNIKTGSQNNDALAGATIYGDGSLNLNNCMAERININVDAPGSSIGNLYATNTAHRLTKDVKIYVENADSIEGINGGNITDNFTNTIVSGTTNRAELHIEEGVNVKVGSGGVQNFTLLELSGGTIASQGKIANGSGATAGNHGTSYHLFGDIILNNGGNLQVLGKTVADQFVSAGQLKTTKGTEITSPSGAGKINVTSFEGEQFTWTRNGGDALATTSMGTWFGVNPAYRVLTFTPTAGNSKTVSPENLKGVDEVGKTYIGDNDPVNGYGIAVAGSFVEYRVSEGNGTITHNMDHVSLGPAPVKIYGSVPKDTPVTEGFLAIPIGGGIPTLTFTPNKEDGSWLKDLTITKSDNTVEQIPEQTDSKVKLWTSPDSQFSYDLDSKFSNKAELSVTNTIITESEAKTIANEEAILKLNQVLGRPFLKNNITNAMIEELKKPLAKGVYSRKHSFTYSAGVESDPANYMEQIANIIVVPDTAKFPVDKNDRSVAIFAMNAKMELDEAQVLTGQEQLDTDYTKAMVIFADGTTGAATIDGDAIRSITEATERKDIPVTYTYTKDGETSPVLEYSVVVHIVDNYICKIGDEGYSVFSEAIEAANEADGPSVIEMLIDEYALTEQMTVSQDITITTGSKTAERLPYKGDLDQSILYLQNELVDENGLYNITNIGSLTLDNIYFDGDNYITYGSLFKNNGGTITMLDRSVIENYTGPVPAIDNGLGTFHMLGGTIDSNFTDSEKGIVYNGGTMNLEGGSIQYNMTINAGGIYNEGTVNMTGGSIDGNDTKQDGGGIYNDGIFNLSEGVIQNNMSTGNGAGVYNIGTFNMTGGIIEQNITNVEGGGIYQDGTLNVSGTVIIRKNFRGSGSLPENNVYLPTTALTMESYQSNRYITVKGDLTANSYIGVMTETSPANTNRGKRFTIIAVPDSGYTNIKKMESYFEHDQININENAYAITFDKREGGTNLILDAKNTVGFKFTKVDAKNTNLPLEGAEFQLYICNNTTPGHVHAEVVTEEVVNSGECFVPLTIEDSSAEHTTVTSDKNGMVDFNTLEDGTYMLVETKAPKGYQIPVGQWLLNINSSKSDVKDRITITARGSEMPPAFISNIVSADVIKYKLPNIKPFVLPLNGGKGIMKFMMAGNTLMACALALYFLKKKKRNQN